MIADQDLLRFFVSDGGEILAAVVVKQSEVASNCSLAMDPNHPNEAAFSFEFLNPNEGCILAILHSGPKPCPTFLGTLKGHRFKIVEGPWKKPIKGANRWVQPLMLSLVAIAGSAMVVFANLDIEQQNAIGHLFNSASATQPPSLAARLVVSLFGLSYVAFAFRGFWRGRRGYPKSLAI